MVQKQCSIGHKRINDRPLTDCQTPVPKKVGIFANLIAKLHADGISKIALRMLFNYT